MHKRASLMQFLLAGLQRLLVSGAMRCALALACFVLLSSCKQGDCIDAASFAEVITSSNTVHANGAATTQSQGKGYYTSINGLSGNYLPNPGTYGSWVDTGVTVSRSDTIEITAQGTIFLSPPVSSTFVVQATATDWLDTNVDIAQKDYFSITTKDPTINTGSCSYSTAKTCTSISNCVNVWDRGSSSGDRCLSGGNGLVGAIGSGNKPSNLYDDQSYAAAPTFEGNRDLAIWNSSGGRLYLALKDRFDDYEDWVDCSVDGYVGGSCQMDPTKSHWGQKKVHIPYRDDNKGGYAVTLLHAPVSVVKKNGDALDVLITDPTHTTPANRSDGQRITLSGGRYTGAAPADGKIWLRVHDNNDTATDFSDNTGEYQVVIKKTVIRNQTFSSLVNSVVTPIQNLLQNTSQAVYTGIVADTQFKKIVVACLILYVIFYALFFMLGMLKDKHTELVIRVAKIGIMLALISDTSWQFFNTHLFSLFSDGSRFLLGISTGSDGSSTNVFSFLDTTVGQFFVSTTWKKIGALVVAFPLGTVYAGIILYSMTRYLMAVIEATLAYLTSFIAISVMIIMAPFFLVGTLFSITRPLFDTWVNHLLSFTLQPVLLFTCLMFFNQFMVIAFYKALYFKVCYDCLLQPQIPMGDIMGNIKLPCLMYYWLPDGFTFEHLWSPADMFASVMMCLIISDATYKFVDSIPDITGMLTETGLTDRIPLSTTAVMDRMRSAPRDALEVAKIVTGTDKASSARRKKDKERDGGKT